MWSCNGQSRELHNTSRIHQLTQGVSASFYRFLHLDCNDFCTISYLLYMHYAMKDSCARKRERQRERGHKDDDSENKLCRGVVCLFLLSVFLCFLFSVPCLS